MGPWQCSHLHEFSLQASSDNRRNVLTSQREVLRIASADLLEDEDDILPMPGIPPQRPVQVEAEETLLLSDVYDPAGRLQGIAAPNGEFLPLIYMYDFGVRILVFIYYYCHCISKLIVIVVGQLGA